MADDSGYYPDVIRWLLAHPADHPGYLARRTRRPHSRTGRRPRKNQLRHQHIQSLRPRPRRRPPPHRRLLPRRPRHARVRLRHQLPLRPLQRLDRKLRPRLPQQPPLQIRDATWRTSPPSSAANPTQRTGTARADARKARHQQIPLEPRQRPLLRLRLRRPAQSTYNFITAFYPLWAGLATPQQATALEQHSRSSSTKAASP